MSDEDEDRAMFEERRREMERRFPRRYTPYAPTEFDTISRHLVYPDVVADAGEEAHTAVMWAIANANGMDILDHKITSEPTLKGWVTYRITLADAYVGAPQTVVSFMVEQERKQRKQLPQFLGEKQ